MHFYSLCPLAVITGLISGGYLSDHPNGTSANLMTGHFTKVMKSCIKYVSPKRDVKGDRDTIILSSGMILCFMLGAFGGNIAAESEHMDVDEFPRKLYPNSTLFSVVMSVLVCLFDSRFNNLAKLLDSIE